MNRIKVNPNQTRYGRHGDILFVRNISGNYAIACHRSVNDLPPYGRTDAFLFYHVQPFDEDLIRERLKRMKNMLNRRPEEYLCRRWIYFANPIQPTKIHFEKMEKIRKAIKEAFNQDPIGHTLPHFQEDLEFIVADGGLRIQAEAKPPVKTLPWHKKELICYGHE